MERDNIVRINIDTYALVMHNGKPMLRITVNYPEKIVKRDNTSYKLSRMKKVFYLSTTDRFYQFHISDNLDDPNTGVFSDTIGMADLTHILKSSEEFIMTPGYEKIVNTIHSTIKAYVNEVIVNFLTNSFRRYDGYKLTLAGSSRVLTGMYDSNILDMYTRAMLVHYCKQNDITLFTDDNDWYKDIPELAK